MDFEEIADADGAEEITSGLNELTLYEDTKEEKFKSLKDVVIYLIDCNHTLLDKAIFKIITVIESFLKTKIITNQKDLFSLILYNTKVKSNILNFDGINLLIGMTEPDAKLIKEIKILSNYSDPSINTDYSKFIADKFCPITNEKETSLNDALWICQTEMKTYDPKKFNRRIFLFTENDNPMINENNERTRTILRAKDMIEAEIVIELFPMNLDKQFDMKKFYSDIITFDDTLKEDLILNRGSFDTRLRELTKRIRQKEVKKRTLGKCPFFLTKNVKIIINFYSCLRKATKPKSYIVDGKTNKNLNVINHTLCKETGSVLYPNQVQTYQEYGGTKVVFTKEDMMKVKTLDEPGFKLMGFKDMKYIKPYHNLKNSYFLYPNEYFTKGSSQLCDALIKQMIVKNKVAIVKFIPREGATIRFCALLPQKESFDEDLFQTPPGFNLIFLPYADDIRDNSEIFKKVDISCNVGEDNIKCAKVIIKKMNIDFDCRNFENPTLQNFYATLQALALGELEKEKVEDLLNPDLEGMKKVLDEMDVIFRESIYEEGKGIPKPIIGKSKDATKKTKKTNEEENDLTDMLMDIIEDENVKGKRKKKVAIGKGSATKKKTGKTKQLDLIDEEVFTPEEGKQKEKMQNEDVLKESSELNEYSKKTTKSNKVDISYKEKNKENINYIPKTKSKLNKSSDLLNDDDLNNLRNNDPLGLEVLTIKDLKEVLSQRNVKTSIKDKKEDLLIKLVTYLDK